MKIALAHSFLGGRAGGGGGVRQMLELARGLKQEGHQVVVCAQQYEPGCIEPEPTSEFEVRAVNTGRLAIPKSRLEYIWFSWIQTRALAALVPRDVDVLNVHESPAHLAGLHFARSVDTPVIWTRNDATLYEMALMPEEMWTPIGNLTLRALRRGLGFPDRRAARRMDAISVLDSRNRRMVERAYGRSAEIIQSGAAAKFFAAPPRAEARQKLGFPKDEFSVLCLGISAPYRRHEDLIDAVGLLADSHPELPIHARIIGSDHVFPEVGNTLRSHVASRSLGDRVELIQKAVPESTLVAHFAAADVFVFPNELQTWGLAPLEAIAARTPVVVSRGAGVHEVLENRAGVEVVNPRSPREIADALLRVARDRDAYDVTETRIWSEKNFGAENYATQMLKLFSTSTQFS